MVIKNVLMDGDKSVCCFFRKKKYTLTIIASNGTVSGAGTYNAGTQANIQATPNAGYQFDHWSGDLSGSINPTTILMNSNKTVTANFVLIPVVKYTLTTSVDPVDGGIVTGAGNYDKGTNVTVEAIPAVDYEFDHWNGATGIWAGLGIQLFETSDNVEQLSPKFSERVDELLANGFKQIRIDVTYWNYAPAIAIAKQAITIAVAKGANVTWGVGSGAGKITATNWPNYRQAIKDNAQWAQNNGVYEFQLGNEEEVHVDGVTITGAQMITNLKAVATEVQAIFTRGNISYSYGWQYDDNWIAAGRGDIDIIAGNLYMGGNGDYNYPWKAELDRLVAAFGVDHTYLTEFAPSYSAIENYSTDEAVQAQAVTEMINYLKSVGVRGNFFCYYDDSRPFGVQGFGALKTDGTYRQLWQSLLNS